MPFYRKPKLFTPLSIQSEKKSIKHNLRHAIFTPKFDKYVGEWRSDLRHGKGFLLTVSGKLYEGDWSNGKKHGSGTLSYRFPDGTFRLEYRGDWVADKPDGVGWRYHRNGDVYFGFWKRGRRHGYGKMWYADSTMYVGYWNMNEKEGLGMFVQENGNRYEGHWDGNKKNGKGRFYHMNTGQMQEGCWEDDFCVMSKMLDINVRHFCECPTEYPIPPECLHDSRIILEECEHWFNRTLEDIDKQLKKCIG